MSDELKALRLEAGARIDPNTAEVWFDWGYIVDPYGDYDDLLPEEKCIGRRYFARSPEPGSIPVSFYDLPPRTRDTLQDMIDKDYPFGTALGMDWP